MHDSQEPYNFCCPTPVCWRRLRGDLTVLNHSTEAHVVDLRFDIDWDFADLFEVKDALRKKGRVLSRHAGQRAGARLQA